MFIPKTFPCRAKQQQQQNVQETCLENIKFLNWKIKMVAKEWKKK